MLQYFQFSFRIAAENLSQLQRLSIPKTTSSHAVKTYAALARSYDTIARIFKDGIAGEDSARRLVAETEAGRAIWREVRHLLIRQSRTFGWGVRLNVVRIVTPDLSNKSLMLSAASRS